MDNNNSNSILAAYATFKELYSSKKYNSPYQILSEYIRYIIKVRALYSFSLIEIQSLLEDDFGFVLPIAVIKTAIKTMESVEIKENTYTIDSSKLRNEQTDIIEFKNRVEKNNEILITALKNYSKHISKGNSIQEERLIEEFIHFVLDEEGDPNYQQVISEFILINESDAIIQEAITEIRIGSILYSGLSYNISELGSIKKPIVLFLDTEIIFDIVGLNGEVYQKLGNDFLDLVSSANREHKKITLKYFKEVKDDINRYFDRAERVVEGKKEPIEAYAMKCIVSGCKDISDVIDKRTELYRKLQYEYGIIEDDRLNYYKEDDTLYNLEGEQLPDYPLDDTYNQEGYKYCSHINKLRKADQSNDYLQCGYLCISDTRRVLQISEALSKQYNNSPNGEVYCGYAVSLSRITNLLWYKLNRGFGSNQFPANLEAITKSRVVLSGYISQGITATYESIVEQYKNSAITKEEAAVKIMALRSKTTVPEELTDDNIEDSLSFDKHFFEKFAENIAVNKRIIEGKNESIDNLKKSLAETEKLLEDEKRINEKQQIQINELKVEIGEIRSEQKRKEEKRNNRIAIGKLCWGIAWKIIALLVIVFIVKQICNYYQISYSLIISVFSIVIPLVPAAVIVFKHDIEKYKRKVSPDNDSHL